MEAAFEGLRATREPVPGFAPDDFLPQLRCSSDGGRTFDEAKPPVSAMLHADVRAAPGDDDSLANPEFEIAVKFSTTRFVLARTSTAGPETGAERRAPPERSGGDAPRVKTRETLQDLLE